MFTIEELSIIKMYSGFTPDRDRVILALKESLPLIEEPEIRETVKSVLRKSNAMTKESFATLDLSNTFETTGL